VRGSTSRAAPPAQTETLERAKERVEHPARTTRRDAEQGRGWYAWTARAGLIAKGFSYGLVGALAAALAFGAGGKATSRQGALATVADEPGGAVLLGVLALGFTAYAIWRFVQAFAEREEEDDAAAEAKKWGKRAGYVGRGFIYAALAVTTTSLLTSSGRGSESQNEQARETTATILEWPGGRWLVGLAGAAIIGAGAWNIYRALTRKFEDHWRTGEMSESERTWGSRAGAAGHLARGIVFGLIGIFIAKAALEYDPSDAIGLDGALQKLLDTTHGPYLLGVTAVGLICYGLYCLVDARYRDVSANAGS
jgi:Domain of Unknown Function (DUF1206)